MEKQNIIPENIENHLAELLLSMDNSEVTIKDLRQSWLDKENLLARQAKSLCMVELEELPADDKRAALFLTYSGSLISIYTAEENFRNIEYASIKMRSDVPDVVTIKKTALQEMVKINHSAFFTSGDVKKTSSIYKIFTFDNEVEKQEQDNRIREATIFLTNAFVQINRAITSREESKDNQYDMRAIARYIAGKNNVSQTKAKEILDDYLSILKTGLILSGRVSLGNIGNMNLKLKKAQSAKVVKLPSTGEEITVKAKPQMYIPKISFNKKFKDEISEIEVLK